MAINPDLPGVSYELTQRKIHCNQKVRPSSNSQCPQALYANNLSIVPFIVFANTFSVHYVLLC